MSNEMNTKTKTTYVATAPDGSTLKRTTETRVYTHAVLVYGPSWNNAEPHWGVVSFNGSAALAAREASKWIGNVHVPQITDVRVVEVELAGVREVKSRAGRTACIGSGQTVREAVTAEVWESIKHDRGNAGVPCQHCGREVNLTRWHRLRSHKA